MTVFQLLVFARWIHFSAVFVLFGSSLFWLYMGEMRPAPGLCALPRARHATTILLRIAAPVATLSGLAWLAGILANIAGGWRSVVDPVSLHLFFFATQFGPVAILRLVLLAVALVIAVLPSASRVWLTAQVCVAAPLLVNQAWLGHAAEGSAGAYGTLMIIAYSLHLLAAAAWVGGLVPLLLALSELRHANPDNARARTFSIMSRYSLMAMVAVTVIVSSGIANAGFRVADAFNKLFWTNYGNVLGAKLFVVALMLALAYVNRFVAMPRLRVVATKEMMQTAGLRASIAIELMLGVLVLGIAAVLGITPPPQ